MEFDELPPCERVICHDYLLRHDRTKGKIMQIKTGKNNITTTTTTKQTEIKSEQCYIMVKFMFAPVCVCTYSRIWGVNRPRKNVSNKITRQIKMNLCEHSLSGHTNVFHVLHIVLIGHSDRNEVATVAAAGAVTLYTKCFSAIVAAYKINNSLQSSGQNE